jgi:hypothetical protein
MLLEHKLRQQDYDFIEGALRNHKELQLWLKKPMNRVEIQAEHIGDQIAFKKEFNAAPMVNPALKVSSKDTETYGFDEGLKALDGIMEKMGLGKLSQTFNGKKGVEVELSYDSSECREYPRGQIEAYLDSINTSDLDGTFKDHLNDNDVLVITGVLYAKNFTAKIHTNFSIDAALDADIKNVVEGKVGVKIEGDKTIVLSAEGINEIPIAVKAHRLRFRRGKFKGMNLITDHTLNPNGMFN